MNICVDVGNTTIIVGVYENDSIVERLSFTTDIIKTDDEYLAIINSQIKDRHIDVSRVEILIYSSVVPSLNRPLKSALKRAFKVDKIMVIEPGIKTGLSIKVDNPNEIGNDLIADLVAAKEKYGFPCLIIDLGTASKILLLDKNGNFSSCAIMPGFEVSANSLFNKAALLPSVSLESKKTIIAKNTVDAMNAGIVFGHADMIIGMCNRYEKELGYSLKRILTGGSSILIRDILGSDFIYEQNLTLDGLNYIIRRNSYEK
mgnify:CR=1 FL=1